ncbi:hypothetical protein JCM16303_002138 [Sporobolomyces ruberrimus]
MDLNPPYWDQMEQVMGSIRTAYLDSKRTGGIKSLDARLEAIRSLLKHVWDTLTTDVRKAVFDSMWLASVDISEAVEEETKEGSDRDDLRMFCHDRMPSSFHILQLISSRIPIGSWWIPIPKFFFEAVLSEVFRAGLRQRTVTRWKGTTLRSDIGQDWEGIDPRAQLAIVERTHTAAFAVEKYRRQAEGEVAAENVRRLAEGKSKKYRPRLAKSWDKLLPSVHEYERIKAIAVVSLTSFNVEPPHEPGALDYQSSVQDSRAASSLSSCAAPPRAYFPEARTHHGSNNVFSQPSYQAPPLVTPPTPWSRVQPSETFPDFNPGLDNDSTQPPSVRAYRYVCLDA